MIELTPWRLRSEVEAQCFAAEPGDRDAAFRKAGGDQKWIVGPLVHPDCDLGFGDYHLGSRVDKVSEDMARFGRLVAVSHLGAQEPVETAGHESELHIAVDLHGDR